MKNKPRSREEVRKLKTMRNYICHFDVEERHAEVVANLGEDRALCGPDGDPGRVEITSSRDHRRFTELENKVLARLAIEKVPGRMVQSSGTPFYDWIQEVAAGAERLASLGECGFVAEIRDIQADHVGLGIFLEEGERGYLLRGLLVDQDLRLDYGHGPAMTIALVATQLLREGTLGLWSRDRLTYCPVQAPIVALGVGVARDIAIDRLAQLRELSGQLEL